MVASILQDAPGWEANYGGQWAFIACPFWEALADGDRGGGKSAALLAAFLAHVGQGWGSAWRGVVFRRTYPELGDLIDRSHEMMHMIYPSAKFNKQEKEWSFNSGEKLLFRHLEGMKDYWSYHGHSIPFLAFDELCSWPSFEPYEAMLSCSRPTRSIANLPLMVRSCTNSWGVGHHWVKARFIAGRERNVPYGTAGRERIRIPIKWAENVTYVQADPDYHVRLAETISNEAQRKAWIDNSWDIVAGGRFSDLWRESTHVMEPFNIPYNWRVDRAHDWGSSAPFCTLWFAESNGESIPDGRKWPKGTIFVIHEDYGCQGDMLDTNWKPNVGLGLTPQEIAARVRHYETQMRDWGLIDKQPQPGPADDPIFDTSRGQSMASMMSASPNHIAWLRPSKGPGSRVARWQALEARLKASRAWPMESPGLFIFDGCKHLIRTLPSVPRDAKKPDDVDTHSEDHAVDTLGMRLAMYSSGNVVRGVSL